MSNKRDDISMKRSSKTVIDLVDRMLKSLSRREEKVVRMRFGLGKNVSDEIILAAYRRLLAAVFDDQAVKPKIVEYRPAIGLAGVVEKVTQLTPELIEHLRTHEQDIQTIPWDVFEHLVAEFLCARGYEDVRLVGRDPTTSADVYAAHSKDPLGTQMRFFVEIKRTIKAFGIQLINEVLGAVLSERPSHGWHAAIIVSTGGFKNLRKFSKHELSYRGLELKDREDLLYWLHDYRPNKNGLWLPHPLRQVPPPRRENPRVKVTSEKAWTRKKTV
jgi:hypothetical protein